MRIGAVASEAATTSTRREVLAGLVVPATLALVLAGCTLRLIPFFGGRSLWLDEAMVALNIVYLPPALLRGELMLDQMAPVGWLLLQKALLSVWSDFDYSLRLTSLVFGVGALLAFWRFARAALGPVEAIIAVGLFAICPALIEYSVMAKPYAVDVFFSVVLMLLAHRVMAGDGRRLSWTLALGAVGLLGVVLSYGAIVVMAAVGLVLFARGLLEGDRRWLALLAVMGAIWLALFAATYRHAAAGQTETVDAMVHWWRETFAPLPPTSLAELAWYPKSVSALIGFVLGNVGPWVAELLFLAGFVALVRDRRWLLALCIGPFVSAVLISGLRAYPFGDRLTLYLAPQMFILLAAGVTLVATRFRPRLLGAAVLSLLLAWPALKVVAARTASTPPWAREEIAPNLAILARDAKPEDTIFVAPQAEFALLLYGPRYGLDGRDYVVGRSYRTDSRCAYADAELLRRSGRSWIVFYHLSSFHQEGRDLLLRTLKEVGTLTLAAEQPGALLYLFEPKADAPFVTPGTGPHCDRHRTARQFLEGIAGAGRARAAADPPRIP